MQHEADVIVVGGGPAGAACAGELTSAGYSTLILDKAEFPRDKLCAGWITPRVFRLLGTAPEEYPHHLTRFRRLHFRFRGVPFAPPTRQFAVRRVEFDHWLLQRSGADVVKHNVRHIESTSRGYLVDGTYSGRFIVGAGGTQCPVARSLFPPSPEAAARRIVTLEEELPYESGVEKCYLWFFDRGLPGYAWYIPKTGGFTTVGIGGLLAGMQRRGTTIREHWNRLTGYLNGHNMLPRRPLRPAGHSYYLRGARRQLQQGSAYLVGDAAGLATRDMGEGIGPAIHSGRLAAHAIINGRSYSAEGIGAYSLRDILLPPKPYSQLR